MVYSPTMSYQKDASFTLLHDLFPAKVLSFFFNLSKVLGKCKTLNLVLCERIPSGWYILW